MSKLYAVLLGGRMRGCNTELHDVVFVVGNTLEETYPKLVNKWFGTHKRLHIDSSVELKYIDGYEISISTEKPSNNNLFLHFVNFGGYKPDFFGEIHEVNFYVTPSKTEALAKAKKDLCVGLFLQHCDDNLPVEELIDDVVVLDAIDRDYYIHLTPTSQPTVLNVESNYRKLDIPAVIEQAALLKQCAV